MKKIISAVIVLSAFVPFMASAATLAECTAQGRTLGADNECHPDMADCVKMQGGPVLIGYQCVLIPGGGIPGGAVRQEWVGGRVYRDPIFGNMMDISVTPWWTTYMVDLAAQLKERYGLTTAQRIFPQFSQWYR